ncbi:MAG: ribonuclease E/G [Hyphomicrobiales bacterium]
MADQPQLFISLNINGKRNTYAQIAKTINGKLVFYDIWGLNPNIENVNFSAPDTAIGSVYIARITKLDANTKMAFVTLGKLDAVLPLKAKQNFIEGQYILAEIISHAFDDKSPRVRYVGDVKSTGKNRPQLFRQADNLGQYCLSLCNTNDQQIITDDYAFSATLNQDLNVKVENGKKSSPSLLEKYDLAEQIDELSNTEICLENGGNIIIQHTAAMTVVDVNSSSYNGKNMVADINNQAALKIIEQLALRQISGLVIVDFLKILKKYERQKFGEYLRELTLGTNIEMGSYTAFGLAEFKIKRQGKRLADKLLDMKHD